MKGQYFSFDAIIASVIFLLAVVALLSYWYSVKTFLDYQNEDLSKEAVRISNLIFSPHSSSDCTTGSFGGLSLSWDDRRLDQAFLECLRHRTLSQIDESFRGNFAIRANNNLFVNISQVSTSLTGRPLTYQYGIAPGSLLTPPTEIVSIRRLGTIVNQSSGNTSLAIVNIVVYR